MTIAEWGPSTLSAIGVIGFFLAGRKIWWSWYINIACQILWVIFALSTQQLGFLLGAAVYVVVFTGNAYRWTRDRHGVKRREYDPLYPTMSWTIAHDLYLKGLLPIEEVDAALARTFGKK